MDNKPNKRVTSIRLDLDLRRRVGHVVQERKYKDSRFTFEAAVHEALEQWVTEKPKNLKLQVQIEAPSPFQEANREWHSSLEAILNHGGMDAAAAVKTMLTALLRPAMRKPKKQKTG